MFFWLIAFSVYGMWIYSQIVVDTIIIMGFKHDQSRNLWDKIGCLVSCCCFVFYRIFARLFQFNAIIRFSNVKVDWHAVNCACRHAYTTCFPICIFFFAGIDAENRNKPDWFNFYLQWKPQQTDLIVGEGIP